ncbi:hypothetical protein ACQ4PT_046315 [Festuca glaucescens]
MGEQAAAASSGETPPPLAPAEMAGAAAAGQRMLPTPFLNKTYQLVDDPAVDDVISWNDDGSTFVVWRPAEFARDLLPKYFKHDNFSSFIRQLNTYGFRKIIPDRWEFANDCFRRGEKRLLVDIHRRKVTPAAAATAIPMALPVAKRQGSGSPVLSGEEQVLSSSSSPEPPFPNQHTPSYTASGDLASGDLGDENEQLRRENSRLARELGQMKKLCNNIFALMSKYTDAQQADAVNATSAAASGETTEATLLTPPSVLDLLPSCPSVPSAGAEEEEEKMSARLFGVCIGRKRMRGHDGEEDPASRGAAEVKPEPMDAQQQCLTDGHAALAQAWPIYRPRPVYHPFRAEACSGSNLNLGYGHAGSNSR